MILSTEQACFSYTNLRTTLNKYTQPAGLKQHGTCYTSCRVAAISTKIYPKSQVFRKTHEFYSQTNVKSSEQSGDAANFVHGFFPFL